MLEWMEEYATGVQLVDIQHRALIQQINRLEAMTKAEQVDPAEVGRLVGFLGNYIVSHFKFEENCMKRRSCPAYQANKQAHDQIVVEWTQFKVQYDSEGADQELLQKLLERTQAWIKHHILKIDLQLKDSVTGSGF